MKEDHEQTHHDRGSSASIESTLLLIGGLLIVFLGQYLTQISPHKLITTLLLFVGASSFLTGIITSNSKTLAGGLHRILEKIAGYMNISIPQVLLLFFGLSLSLASRAAASNALIAHSPWHAWIWITGWLSVIAALWRGSAKDILRGIDRWDWLLTGILAAIALATRLIQLDQVPYTLSGDEGSVGLMAWDYTTGVRNNLLIMGWFSFPALQFLPASIFQEIFGRSVLPIRIPSAIGGTLAVLAVYWCVRHMFGRLPGLIAALFLTLFHYHLLFSRIALPNVWDGFFLILMIAAIWYAWQENNRIAFISAGIAIGLGQYFYSTGHLLPIYALLWLIVLWKSRPKTDRSPEIIVMILVAIAIVLPLALFYVENPNEFAAPLNRVTILKEDWIQTTSLNTGDSVFTIFAKQFSNAILGFTKRHITGVYSPSAPMLRPLPSTLFIAGLIITLLRIKKPEYNILLISLIGPVLASTFSLKPPNAQRLLLAAPIAAIIIALPLYEIYQQISATKPQYKPHCAAATVVFMLLIGYSELGIFQQSMQEGHYSDPKSLTATKIAQLLRQQETDLEVYFLGQPVMDYHTLPSLPYIAYNATGHDLTLPIDWEQFPDMDGKKTAFVILVQNAEALPEIEQRFPHGTTNVEQNGAGQTLYYYRFIHSPSEN